MRDAERQGVSGTSGASLLRARGISDERVHELEAGGRLTIARAMSIAAAMEGLVSGGLSAGEVDRLLPALARTDLATPRAHADAVASLVRRVFALGLGREDAVSLASYAAREKTAAVSAAAEDIEASLRAALDAGMQPPAATALVARACADGSDDLRSRVASALASLREEGRPAEEAARALQDPRPTKNAKEGGRTMIDPGRRNGSAASGNVERERVERERLARERENLEREREKLARERERADLEREKLDREREKLDRLQEALEERLERQEERLDELEEQLEERMEALDEAEESLSDLEEIEVEGVEGIREMLDAVTDQLPRIMRGIQESVYSREQVAATAEAVASFFKTLVDSGMPHPAAADITREHFDKLQAQMAGHVRRPFPPRKGRRAPGPDFDPLGPNFDPLGPNFDPFGSHAEPPEPPEPAEPCAPR